MLFFATCSHQLDLFLSTRLAQMHFTLRRMSHSFRMPLRNRATWRSLTVGGRTQTL